jgi:hypothetical protein
MSSDLSRGRVQPAGTRLEDIAEAARRAGILIDPDGHDWEPNVMVRAWDGAWLISPWPSTGTRGWCAQQMVKVELDWLRIPDTRVWLGAAGLEPDQILGRLRGAAELPREPDGEPIISTRRVLDAEIRNRLVWLGSSGLKVAKARRSSGSLRTVASLTASVGSFAASSGREVGARAGVAAARAVLQGAHRLRDYPGQRESGQSLRIVPQPGTPTLSNGGVQRPSRLDARDGEGLLEWDAAARRWRFSGSDPDSQSAPIPRIRVPPPHPNGGTDSQRPALRSPAQD